jgi:hypothetical protein
MSIFASLKMGLGNKGLWPLASIVSKKIKWIVRLMG